MARATTERPPVMPLVQRSRDRIRRGETNHRVEFLAGLTTFVTMAYIIFVNPAIMSASGLDKIALLGHILQATIHAA